jgi:hypothetical protein
LATVHGKFDEAIAARISITTARNGTMAKRRAKHFCKTVPLTITGNNPMQASTDTDKRKRKSQGKKSTGPNS